MMLLFFDFIRKYNEIKTTHIITHILLGQCLLKTFKNKLEIEQFRIISEFPDYII